MTAPAGLFASLRRVAGSVLELVELRVALFATELEQEKLRVGAALAWACAALLLLGLGLLMAALLVVVLFWDGHRLAALGLLALAFLAGAVAAWRVARARLTAGEGAFALTLAELRSDRRGVAGAAADDGAAAPRPEAP
jgi:uncharacterized membrane protein YqjE